MTSGLVAAESDYARLTRTVLDAARITSPTSYTWFGQRSPVLMPRITRAMTPAVARDFLVSSLTRTLYRDFYCAGRAVPDRQGDEMELIVARTPFVNALAGANTGRGRIETQWTVRALDDGMVSAERDGLLFWGGADEFIADTPLAVGSVVSVASPKERLGLSPGFYLAIGDMDSAPLDGSPLVRVYWNVTADGAPDLMRSMTSTLNAAEIPFDFKVGCAPGGFTRCDAAVLYVPGGEFPRLAPVLANIHDDIARHLKPATPAFTKCLRPGLGLAEDPVTDESFGQHRCRLIAEAMVNAYEHGARSVDDRLCAVVQRFATERLTLDRPYLNAGSTDDYAVPDRARAFVTTSERTRVTPRPAVTPADVAVAIGRNLCVDAIWSGERCNWLGVVAPDLDESRIVGSCYGGLGPNLYDGSAGVALFLAYLHAATGEADAARTARGGIVQALAAYDDDDHPDERNGLYSGRLGVALAAARGGRLLHDGGLEERAHHLAAHTIAHRPDRPEYDVLHGRAGEVVALLALERHFRDESFARAARRAADDLLRTADATHGTMSWGSVRGRPNLVGFAHGAAGVAYALAELFHATRDERYRAAARAAFAYEQRWFDAAAGNWPDLTTAVGRGKRTTGHSFLVHWCHGAPGAVLARLQSSVLLADDELRREALIGLATTIEALELSLETESGNFSLCHGLAGNAEVLRFAERVAGPGAQCGTMIARIIDYGIARHGGDVRGFPCGAGDAGIGTPALFLGSAGIGCFYLRAAHTDVPSPLMMGSVLDGSEPRKSALRQLGALP